MKTRGLAVTIALLVALGATAAVFLYVQNVKKEVKTPPQTVTVIVSKQDIPAGTKLDNLISGGSFTTVQVPQAAVVPGAITDLSQLQGRSTSTFILQGEQISTARLQGSTKATGGILGIPKGYEAVTVQLQAQAVPAQLLQPGDHVALYATFTDVSIIRSTNLQDFLAGKPVVTGGKAELGDFTVNVVPDVQVLRVTGQSASQGGTTTDIMVTLALRPEDGQRTVFAREQGSIWLALLPPGQKGRPLPPASYADELLAAALAGGAK